jgi:hypothetical protein
VGLVVLGCLMARSHHGFADPDRASHKPVGPGAVIEAFSEDGAIQRFRIDSVEPDPRDRDGDVRLYGVSLFDLRTSTWKPYCAPDVEHRSAAIPVQGSWSARGEFQPGSAMVTLACTSGAIAKCIRFGYKPWATHNGVALQPYHAACVRMVRADYCGDGRSHTVDGTRIDIWDRLGIQNREPQAGAPEVFEAAWGPGGATYLNMPRWSDKVSEVVKECPERFAGRTSEAGALDADQLQHQFPELLIFNARFARSAQRRAAAK